MFRHFHVLLGISVFAVAAPAQTPMVTNVQNNYSFITPNSPNYGIAQGSLMLISGANLVTTSNLAEAFPLQQNLNGTSVAVTVNGTTANPYLYYVYAEGSTSYIAAVLPSAMPAGNASMVVTNNGAPSNAYKFQVVQTAVGLDTLDGAGVGRAVATDANGAILSGTNAANPNQTIVLWGSGVGPDTANTNEGVLPQKQDNLLNLPLEVDIGGMQATVVYQGRSQYPGVDQINVTIPPNVQPGCYVSVVAWTGAYISNFATLPIAANGRICSDAVSGYTITYYQNVFNNFEPLTISYPLAAMAATSAGPLNVGSIVLEQDNQPPGSLFGIPFAPQLDYSNADMLGYRSLAIDTVLDPYLISAGSCTVTPGQGDPGATPLDAGSEIDIAGPGGSQGNPMFGPGAYRKSQPVDFVTSGTYTFTNGTGGADIGALSAGTQFVSPPFVWNEMMTLNTVQRSSPLTVTWSGGAPNSLVLITGTSIADQIQGGSKYFFCVAPVSAQKFTVPTTVLLSLPQTASFGGINSSDWMSVSNSTPPVTFSASGLQFGAVSSVVFNSTGVNADTFIWQ